MITLANIKINCLDMNKILIIAEILAVVATWQFHLDVSHPQTWQVQNCAYFVPKLINTMLKPEIWKSSLISPFPSVFIYI